MLVEFSNAKGKADQNIVLTLPIQNEGFVIYSDASKLGLGSVVMQHDKAVAYASQQLKVDEQNYATLDLKLIVFVFAFKL